MYVTQPSQDQLLTESSRKHNPTCVHHLLICIRRIVHRAGWGMTVVMDVVTLITLASIVQVGEFKISYNTKMISIINFSDASLYHS